MPQRALVSGIRFPYLSLLLCGATLILFFVAPLTSDTPPKVNPNSGHSDLFWLGVLDAQQPTQIWRWFSAHWLHTDTNHLVWNLGALFLLGSIVEQRSRHLLLATLITGMLSVSAWFLWQSGSTYYCGWSGALNSLLLVALGSLYWSKDKPPVAGATPNQRRLNNGILWLIALGALLKNLVEAASGIALVSSTTWQSAPGAHLAGWTAGLLLLGCLSFVAAQSASRGRDPR